ncbi:hypothetical protein GEMRC1_011686 [Eukaryota sp. GEM-RC1]
MPSCCIVPVSQFLLDRGLVPYLKDIRKGVERETLRVNPSGSISEARHASILGSPHTHKYLKLDYAEALEEVVTPPMTSNEDVMEFLSTLLQTVSDAHPLDYFWPFSAPTLVTPNVPVAEFGTSFSALFKKSYRNSLTSRYTANHCQLLAGIHFNFSLPPSILNHLCHKPGTEARNIVYVNCYKNVNLFSFLLVLLTGNSPYLHSSYFPQSDQPRDLPHAISLRSSKYGYRNPASSILDRPVNSLQDYIAILEEGCLEESSNFAGKTDVLSPNLLQVPAEFYSIVRLKNTNTDGIKNEIDAEIQSWNTVDLLKTNGVDYVELRCVDVQSNHLNGISLKTLDFLEIFMIFCCFNRCPALNQPEFSTLLNYFDDLCIQGGLFLKENLPVPDVIASNVRRNIDQNASSSIRDLTLLLLRKEFTDVAHLLDLSHGTTHYRESISELIDDVLNGNLPFQKFKRQIDTSDDHDAQFIKMGSEQASINDKLLMKLNNQSDKFQSIVDTETINSVEEIDRLESRDRDSGLSYHDYHQQIMNLVLRKGLES